MIIHTIVEPELLWKMENDISETMEINYKGVQIEVRKIDEEKLVVNRVISTNLSDYLDTELQPGSIILYTLLSQDSC
jgi:hypothetical protein